MKSLDPRAREGRDIEGEGMSDHLPVSIHAPAGGATADVNKKLNEFTVSIHAPAGGATFRPPALHIHVRVSIHAPAGGATPY